MHPTIQDTLKLAKDSHALTNGMDKTGKVPYYWHLLRVMLRLKDVEEDVLHIALLHDIVEDTPVTLQKLKELGYNDNIINGVRWCSKNMFTNLTFVQWMQKIGNEAPEAAILVKLADIADNCGYERMQGLMNKNSDKPKTNKAKNVDMAARIHRKVNKKMRLYGEMGVFDRYYKAWNLIMDNPKNLELLKHVEVEDFCKLEQLQELSKWIDSSEYINYLSVNNIHTWKVSGPGKVIQDRAGQDYLAIDIDVDLAMMYKRFLANHIDAQFVDAQTNRDKGHFHITFMGSMAWNKLKKDSPEKADKLANWFTNKEWTFFTYGIGTALQKKDDEKKQAWFVVAENHELTSQRQQYASGKQDFHITLAFDNKDVFGIDKDKKTVVFDNKELWQYFCKKEFYNSPKKKPKLH